MYTIDNSGTVGAQKQERLCLPREVRRAVEMGGDI